MQQQKLSNYKFHSLYILFMHMRRSLSSLCLKDCTVFPSVDLPKFHAFSLLLTHSAAEGITHGQTHKIGQPGLLGTPLKSL